MGTPVPSGSVMPAEPAVKFTTCCPKLTLALSRRIAATRAAAFNMALNLKSQVRIVLSPFLKLVVFIANSQRLVDHKFPAIHEQHHEHASGEDVVSGDFALVVGVPHKRPTALVGGVELGVGGH